MSSLAAEATIQWQASGSAIRGGQTLIHSSPTLYNLTN